MRGKVFFLPLLIALLQACAGPEAVIRAEPAEAAPGALMVSVHDYQRLQLRLASLESDVRALQRREALAGGDSGVAIMAPPATPVTDGVGTAAAQDWQALEMEGESREDLSAADAEAAAPGAPVTGAATDVANLAPASAGAGVMETGASALRSEPGEDNKGAQSAEKAIEFGAAAQADPAAYPAPSAALPAADIAIHLASYRKAEDARKGWRALLAANQDLLAGLQPVLGLLDMGDYGGRYLRLKAAGFADGDAATAVCTELKRRGHYCVLSDTQGEPLMAQSSAQP
ncbi:MAG: hypothetical protein ACOY99_02980 [Pseudomonadota bacterium]|jgi:hypothetical protein